MRELDFYRQHSPLTNPGRHRDLLQGLPADPAELAVIIDGFLVHRDETVWRHGFELPEARRAEADTRYVEAILGRVGPLAERPPEERFAGTCRDFTVLLCAMLREAGLPARARCGFAGYFSAEDFFHDHWVVELWQDGRGWHLVDAQVAGAPQGTYKAAIDPLDVPRDQFVVAGQAWADCRAGRSDPARFGVGANLTGMWEIQGNVVRDLASLNRLETLPWDDWELIPVHYDGLGEPERELLDRAARVGAAGGPLEQAIALYESDPRLQVPARLR
jgi:Transglutaminase-like superfamily